MNEGMVDCDFCNLAFHMACVSFKAGRKKVAGKWACSACLKHARINTESQPIEVDELIVQSLVSNQDYLLAGLRRLTNEQPAAKAAFFHVCSYLFPLRPFLTLSHYKKCVWQCGVGGCGPELRSISTAT